MSYSELFRCSDGQIIAEKAFFARTRFSRLQGMIGRKFAASPFDAMVFERCNSVHCCWMSEAIDVLFIDTDMEVVRVFSRLKPWKFACGGRKAATTVELPAGTIEKYNITAGDMLKWK